MLQHRGHHFLHELHNALTSQFIMCWHHPWMFELAFDSWPKVMIYNLKKRHEYFSHTHLSFPFRRHIKLWIRSLLQIVTCECATARVGGARPSTIDAWQCFLLDIRDCIKEWLLCFYCPSLSPSLLIGPWDVEYVSVVLFCYILDAMLCYVWKKKIKKMLITKRRHIKLNQLTVIPEIVLTQII